MTGASSPLLLSSLSSDGSLAAIYAPSPSSSRKLVQVFQVSASSCTLQLTLTHATSNPLEELMFVGTSTVAGRFGTGEVIVWDLDRGVVANKLVAADDQSFWGIAASAEDDTSYYVLTKHSQKLYIHEFSSTNYKLTRKIKSGGFEGNDDGSDTGLVVTSNHALVRTAAGVRVMNLTTGKKAGKIKTKGGNTFSSMVAQEKTLAVMQNSGGVVLYNVETCKQIDRVSHEVSAHPSLQLLASGGESSGCTLLVDHSVYQIEGSSHKKITSFSSEQSIVLFLVKNNKVLALVYQKATGSRVQWVDLEDAPSVINLDEEAKEAEEDSTKKGAAKRKSSEPMVLGPGQAGIETAPAVKKAKVVEDGGEPTEEDAAAELTIAERLQKLTEELEDDDDDDDEEDNKDDTPTVSFKPKQATTESLKELLSQALQSGDDSLLELALGVRDVKIISTTLKEIEPAMIITLLTKVTSRLATNPMRAESLAVWLSRCLKIGRFQPQHLAGLRNLLYERIESFPDLLRLEGRLSMMCDVE